MSFGETQRKATMTAVLIDLVHRYGVQLRVKYDQCAGMLSALFGLKEEW